MATNIKKTSVSGRVPNTFTLSADGDIGINTHDGKLWVSNGSVVFEIGAGGGGSGVPGGLDTQIQFNDSNQFAGDAGLTYNKTTDALTLAGLLYVGANVIANTSALFVGNSSVNSVITSSSASLGNTTITGFANVSSTLAAGNTTITGFANVSSTLAAGNTTIAGFANVSADATIHAYTVGRGNSAHITNLAFGYNALANSATYADGVDPYSGRWNVGIGYQTLLNNTDGYDNIAIGYRALAENTTAYDNIAIGDSALSNNVTGDSNIAIGSWSQVEAKGYGNISIGHYSMGYANSDSYENISIGYSMMNSLGGGARNIGIGKDSLYSVTDGSYNTSFGFRSGYSLTSGGGNITMGVDSLRNVTTGSNNIAVGYETMYGGANSNANYNIGIGSRCLYSITTGGLNIAMGLAAANSITTGNNNIALGRIAMFYTTSGENNIAIGDGALSSFGTIATGNGSYNIAIGAGTLSQCDNGQENIALGAGALQTGANGNYNFAAGSYALRFGTGNDNIAVGRDSQNFSGSGNKNISLGANSLYAIGINGNGSNNIAIGYNAGSSLGGSNNLLLGAVTGNSSINDTIIVGTGGGTERFRVDSNGNVAIGTITASNRLQVNGAIGVNQINANGSVGTAGYTLTSGASGNIYWSAQGSEPTTVDSTTSRTLTATDAGTLIEFTNASATTVTVANNATQNIPVNSTVYLIQGNTGQVTVTAGAGVTIDYSDSLKTRTQESIIGLKQIQINKWQLFGDTEPSVLARSALIRSAATDGVPAFVAASADGQVLKRTSGTVGFTAVTAAEVTNTPSGTIAATTVQAAIDELNNEKQPLDTQLTTIAGLTLTGQAGKALKVNSGGTDFELGDTTTDLTNITTDVKLIASGKGIHINEGGNATMGVATLVGGSAVVSTTKVTDLSRIFVSIQSLGTVSVPKAIGVTARTAGVSFTLTSADVTDTSVIAWMIVEPWVTYPSALLRFNGADGSTTITDLVGNVWTAAGNAQIDTAQSKWGGSSCLFDGSGDIVSSTSTSIINLATDFTVEYWVRQATNGTSVMLHTHFYNSGGTNNGLSIYRRVSDGALMVDNGLTATTAGTISISLTTWTHIAVVRDAGTIRGYVDGVQALSHAAQSYPATINLSSIGMFKGNLYAFDGHIDDWRVTNGLCRYPNGTTFTPPTAEFTYP